MVKQKQIFIVILIIQIIVIAYFIHAIYVKSTSQTISVIPLAKNTLTITPIDHLRYFFEPKANMTIIDQYYKQVGLSQAPKYTINKDTLNERFNYTVKKPKNTFRIITLGDTFTYGQYMNTANTWPEILEDSLQSCTNKKFEVINLAVPNYDIQYSVERFKKRGVKYHPDLVIWFLKNDDFLQLNEITHPLKMQYLEEMKKNGDLEKYKKSGEYWPYTTRAVEKFEEKYSTEQILSKQLKIMNEITTYYSGPLLIMTTKYTDLHMKFIIFDFVQKRKNTYIYMDLPEFSILPDHHPSQQGHTEIAADIYKDLINKKLIPCNK